MEAMLMESLSPHRAMTKKEALDWIKHIDEWHPNEPHAQKEKAFMIEHYKIGGKNGS